LLLALNYTFRWGSSPGGALKKYSKGGGGPVLGVLSKMTQKGGGRVQCESHPSLYPLLYLRKDAQEHNGLYIAKEHDAGGGNGDGDVDNDGANTNADLFHRRNNLWCYRTDITTSQIDVWQNSSYLNYYKPVHAEPPICCKLYGNACARVHAHIHI
jgi:hypothetical protein